MISVVPPPISSKQQPRSRSSWVRHTSAEASGSSTVSLMRMPALFAAVTRFCDAAIEDVTTYTLATRRWPTIPTGSRMLSWASTMNSWGRMCKTSRSSGREMLRAASTARRTSSLSMSRGRGPRAMPPRLFTPRTWLPATPISASSTGTLATPSASSTARRIELTVESRLTMRPLRKPLDSAAPSARNFTDSPSISTIRMEVFVLPMSNPTRYLSFFANPPLPGAKLFCFCHHRAGAGVRIYDHLPRILQIDGLDTPSMGLPLGKIVHQHLVLSGKIARAKVHRDRLRIGRASQSGQDHAQVSGQGEIHFADVLRRTAAHQLDILHELLIQLYALFALIARQVLRNAGHDRELEIRVAGTIENHAVGVNERHFVAIARKSDGSAFDELDANAIRENALDGRRLDPGNLLELAPPKIPGNAHNAAIPIFHELLQYGFAANHVIASQLNLLRLQQQHGRRIKKKSCPIIRTSGYGRARSGEKQHAAIERPAMAAQLLAANFNGLLAAQITRLIVGSQLGPVTLTGLRRRGRVPLHGLQAFQTTTSFSKATP